MRIFHFSRSFIINNNNSSSGGNNISIVIRLTPHKRENANKFCICSWQETTTPLVTMATSEALFKPTYNLLQCVLLSNSLSLSLSSHTHTYKKKLHFHANFDNRRRRKTHRAMPLIACQHFNMAYRNIPCAERQRR